MIRLGREIGTGRPVDLPPGSFRTHYHLIGATGKGKTTAIQTILQQLILDPFEQPCVIVFDRLGGLSSDLLMWLASPYCTPEARDRLVYIEPADERYVLGFNPLLYGSEEEGFYKVSRATEIILRAWESVNIEAMPRLARWTFNAFWASAQLGLTVSDCIHFLTPGSRQFTALLPLLPERLRAEWEELVRVSPTEMGRMLESTRNRLKPYFESGILRRMFGTRESRLDIAGFMRGGKVVILNLAPRGRLSTQVADCIGALVLNEVFAVARSLEPWDRFPTYLLLDEFQNFVGPDIESALAEVRQLELRLILSHQSFSQLKRGDYDLTNMIFQAQSRMMFGVQGEDADLLAQELTSLEYDPKRVKEENWVSRQKLTGYKTIRLESGSESWQSSDTWSKDESESEDERAPKKDKDDEKGTKGQSKGKREGKGGSTGSGGQRGWSEHMQPVHEDYVELASRTFYTFDEQKQMWARKVRQLKTGQCVLRLVDDDQLRMVAVERSAPGYLDFDVRTLHEELPEVLEELHALKEANFRSGMFADPAQVDREADERMRALLGSSPQPSGSGEDFG